MKKNENYILLILAAIFILSGSCRKIIPVDLSPKDRKMVVNSVMTTNMVEARISLSIGLNDNSQSIVYLSSATLALYEGKTKIGNLNNGSDTLAGYYRLDNLNLKYETRYTLKLEDAKYGSLTATTQIPRPVQIDTIVQSTQTIGSLDGYTNETFLFAIQIKDSPNQDNYYAITDTILQKVYDYNYETQTDTFYMAKNVAWSMDTQDPASDGSVRYLFLFKDDLFDGKTYSFKINIDKYSFNDTTESEFYLINFSKEYYLYLRTMSAQSDQDNISIILGATPVQVYSNVEGGFGFFGAYSLSSKTIQVIGDNYYPLE